MHFAFLWSATGFDVLGCCRQLCRLVSHYTHPADRGKLPPLVIQPPLPFSLPKPAAATASPMLCCCSKARIPGRSSKTKAWLAERLAPFVVVVEAGEPVGELVRVLTDDLPFDLSRWVFMAVSPGCVPWLCPLPSRCVSRAVGEVQHPIEV